MNEILGKASSHLTGNDNISDINIDELERITGEHPYFSVAHVLLAKRYKIENHSGFLPQVQKTVLFFNNPYWLHYQLLDKWPEPIVSEEVEGHEELKIVAVETPGPAYEFKAPEDDHKETVYTKDEIVAASALAKETLSSQQQNDETLVEE